MNGKKDKYINERKINQKTDFLEKRISLTYL